MADDVTRLDAASLVAKYHQVVYRYAYRLSGSVPDAEDLTQQVFLTAQQKLGQLRKAEAVQSWLFAVLRNCFFKSCRSRQPVPAGTLGLRIEAIPEEIPPREAIDRERLQLALDALPSSYRVVVTMFYFENCSYREIAEKLDLPIGTVMSRLARAKGRLRVKLLQPECHQAANPRPDPPS